MSGTPSAADQALKAVQRRGATVEHLEEMLGKAKVRRVREIHAAYAVGAPIAVIARYARLTPGRVSQIVGEPMKEDGE